MLNKISGKIKISLLNKDVQVKKRFNIDDILTVDYSLNKKELAYINIGSEELL